MKELKEKDQCKSRYTIQNLLKSLLFSFIITIGMFFLCIVSFFTIIPLLGNIIIFIVIFIMIFFNDYFEKHEDGIVLFLMGFPIVFVIVLVILIVTGVIV